MARQRSAARNGTRRTSAASAVDSLRAGMMTFRQQAGEGAEQLTQSIKHQGEQYLERRKRRAAEGIDSLGEVVRLAADRLHARDVQLLADYADLAADRIQRAARFINTRDLAGMTREFEQIARRWPTLALGGLFLAGLAAGRFFKVGVTPHRASNAAPTPVRRRRRRKG